MKKLFLYLLGMCFLFTAGNALANDPVCFSQGSDAVVAKWAAEDIYNDKADTGFNSSLPLYVAAHRTGWGLDGTKRRSITLTQSSSPDYYLAKGMAKTYFAVIQFPDGNTKRSFEDFELGWSQVHKYKGSIGVKTKGNGKTEYFCDEPFPGS